jgi:hypothetical protein
LIKTAVKEDEKYYASSGFTGSGSGRARLPEGKASSCLKAISSEETSSWGILLCPRGRKAEFFFVNFKKSK